MDWIALRFLVTFLPLLFFVLCQLRQFEWRFNDFFDNDDYFFLFFFSLLFLHTLIQSTLSFFSQRQSIQLFFFVIVLTTCRCNLLELRFNQMTALYVCFTLFQLFTSFAWKRIQKHRRAWKWIKNSKIHNDISWITRTMYVYSHS